MQHAILGAGGVGGLIGAVLAHGGDDVTLVVRPGTEKSHPAQLSLESAFGNITAPVRAVATLDTSVDVLWVTCKATQLADALKQVAARNSFGAVVPLLNGIDHVDVLRAYFGSEEVVPATIGVESERAAPGRIIQRSPWVRLRVAERGSAILSHAFDVLQRFGFDCAYVADEATLLWSKLVFIAPVALSTTAARSSIGEVIADPKRRALLEACAREACAVAMAAGAKLNAEELIVRIHALPTSMRSSMQKDRAAGRPLELDAIAGPILRGGERYSISVRATAELAAACAA